MPRAISADDVHATLQNLPTWQSARLTLLACALANGRGDGTPSARALEGWARALGVHAAYLPAMRALRRKLAARAPHHHKS